MEKNYIKSGNLNRRKNRKKNKRNYKIFFIILLIFFIFLFIIITNNHKLPLENSSTETSNESNSDVGNYEQKSDITFNMTAIGDIMCHNTQYWDAYLKETDNYDFSYVFSNIKKYIESADIAIGNLETSFAGKERGYSNYPTFNSPDALAYNLKDIGLDVISTAGNHCLDMGFSG